MDVRLIVLLACAANLSGCIPGKEKNMRTPIAKEISFVPGFMSLSHGFDDNGIFPWNTPVGSKLSLTGNAGTPKTAFTGDDLMANCGDGNELHLSVKWSQKRLLSLFEGKQSFFATALRGLSSSGNGKLRPTEAIQPNLASKLGLGASDGPHYVMTVISLRPDHMKFGYELNRAQSGQVNGMDHVSFIHAIAVNTDEDSDAIKKYHEDILRLSAEKSQSIGCMLDSFLSNWVIERKGQHRFTHTNFFDNTEEMAGSGIAEWRFAELRIVESVDLSKLSQIDSMIYQLEDEKYMLEQALAMEQYYDSMGAEEKDFYDPPGDFVDYNTYGGMDDTTATSMMVLNSGLTTQEKIANLTAKIAELKAEYDALMAKAQYPTIVKGRDAQACIDNGVGTCPDQLDKELSPVPMAFRRYILKADGTLQSRPIEQSFITWFSSKSKDMPLVVDESGNRIQNNCIFQPKATTDSNATRPVIPIQRDH